MNTYRVTEKINMNTYRVTEKINMNTYSVTEKETRVHTELLRKKHEYIQSY